MRAACLQLLESLGEELILILGLGKLLHQLHSARKSSLDILKGSHGMPKCLIEPRGHRLDGLLLPHMGSCWEASGERHAFVD